MDRYPGAEPRFLNKQLAQMGKDPQTDLLKHGGLKWLIMM
jgi:hypothetical protein